MEIDTVLTHLAEMFQDRGEDITEFVEHADAVLRPRYYSEIIVLDTDKTTVFFALKKELVRELVREFKDHETADAMQAAYKNLNFLVVVSELPSSPTMSGFVARDKLLAPAGGMLQVWLLKELMYNPSRHVLVPKHEKMTAEEVDALKQTVQIKHKSQLPHIHSTDVMARYLGLRHGDVARITRYNDTSGEYFFYRYCI